MGADYDNRTSTTDATSTVANEAAMATSASPQETTAEAPSAAAGEVAPKDAKVGDSGPRKTKAGKKPSQPTANGHNQRRQRQGAGAESETAAPTGMRERLLARFDIPSIALDATSCRTHCSALWTPPGSAAPTCWRHRAS
jgi:hypothetical protein